MLTLILTLFAILLIFVAAFCLQSYAAKCRDFAPGEALALFSCVILYVAAGIASVVYCFMLWGWISSGVRADILNREYGTNYTQEEIFYGSDVIDTIRELDRTRIEVNGDIRRERDPQRNLKPDNR